MSYTTRTERENRVKVISHKIYCPLLKRKIETGYCWELCNIATDEILLYGDRIEHWEESWKQCDQCGVWKCYNTAR